ncbi:SPOR domain-containing protein [Ideonella azotifigens]|uniref:SPOR domain-containing protein n=1 Tax=Ideonella azotifigens TaxID=513160 RepID=A0ABN1JL80_9BURK|nr:SPOR domain-containing protein [Ideonella azotifigens]MCD2339699.1 SPOR domain-containing protein [Ideonella azotifigens]
MLRWLLVLLVVANLAVWAWTQPVIAEKLGLHALDPQREPERLARQVNAQALQLLSNGAASAPAPAASTAPETIAASAATIASEPASANAVSTAAAGAACLQAGPLSDQAYGEMTRQLQQLGLRSDGWVDIRRELPGRWAVYMGRFADADALQKKLEEVRRLRLPHEELVNHATLSPGLTLGQFNSQAEAEGRLNQLQQRGVRTARVVALIEPVVQHQLRVETLTAEQVGKLKTQKAATPWSACAPA